MQLISQRVASPADQISRLQLAQQEIDRVFGAGYAAAHPDMVVVAVQTAASDWAAARMPYEQMIGAR